MLFALCGAWCGALCAGEQPQVLEQSRPVKDILRGGQQHSFLVQAGAGEYFRIVLEPNGLPLELHVIAPSEVPVASAMNIAGEQRSLPVSSLAKDTGDYRVDLTVADAEAPERNYQVTLVEIRQATPSDDSRIRAEGDFEDGKRLQAVGDRESLQQAIARFESAVSLWRAVPDQAGQGRALDAMGDAYWSLGQGVKANDCFKQALELEKAAGDTAGQASAISNLGVAVSLRDPKKALEYFDESLKLSRSVGDHNLEGTTLGNVGSVYMLMGDPRKALDFAAHARDLKRASGDRRGEMTMLSNLAAVHAALGEMHLAIEALEETLPIRRKLHDQRGEANTLLNMATAFAQLGEPDRALDSYNAALPLSRAVGDRRGEARTLTNLGALHMALGAPQDALTRFQEILPISRELKDSHLEESVLINMARAYLQLGEAQPALDFSNKALAIQRKISDQRGEGLGLANLGKVFAFMGESPKALESYQQSLTLLRAANDRAGEADVLDNLSELALRRGDPRSALTSAERALELSTQLDDRRRHALALLNAGSAHVALGESQQASEMLRQALNELTSIGDRLQQSRALYFLASLENTARDWEHAREHLDEALGIDEQIRSAVIGPELRESYFATVLDQYDLRIDVLMHLNEISPGRGYDVEAFETSERARARGLLDLLSEAKGGIRQGVDPALLARQRVVTAQLHAKAERQIELLAAKRDDPRAAAVEKEIRALTSEYHDLEAKILEASPRFASFAQSDPLKLAQLQRDYLSPDTLLLEYAPGEARSFVWAATQNTFRAFVLPKRSVLEGMARRAYESLSSAEGKAGGASALTELARALLGPVAGQLGSRRLVIVASGALQYVPFSALPTPSEPGTPLIVSHEIVSLPSASTIAFLRRGHMDSSRASKVLAVLADPVFNADDPRLAHSGEAHAANMPAREAQRSATGFDLTHFDRLPSTRREALAILALVDPRQSFAALDFDASRTTATSPAMGAYRFVHIASHGLLNSLHPELSGIVLSLVDRDGHPQNGFLQTTDVYNLSLHASLVVLSACQTALGKEVRGEGLVGLTRAFMYAGTPRVVASLWTVPDVSTAELMARFYKGMLVDRLRPPAALRQAQISLWKENRWARPYYWAAFTLQGEWK
jgi:CHAT domain-containing protein/Tfp pilus assembly protein PilF